MAIFNTWRRVTVLVFAVALLLGLLATGCSNNSGGSSDDKYNTELTVTLAKYQADAKGTLPSETDALSLALYDSDGVPLDGFGTDGMPVGIICQWTESDNLVSTTLHISDSSASKIAQLLIIAYDEEDYVLGTYSDTVSLVAGESNSVNFATNSAPFVSADDMQDKIEHFSIVGGAAVDSKGVVTMAAGETYNVSLIDKYSNQKNVVFNIYKWGKNEYTLAGPVPASAPITIDDTNKTIEGENVASDVKIELYEKDTENLLDTINLNVVAVE